MGTWEPLGASYGNVILRRDLGNRHHAYVTYYREKGREPFNYYWSVQDGSCGRVLEHGLTDGEEGLEKAKSEADAAAARRVP